MATVAAYRCLSCEELFEEVGGAVYECSKCGGEFTEDDAEERRCPDCHVFMAKTADSCCPGCQEPDPEERECWRGADGKLYESAEHEAEFIAGAPERERKRVESEAFLQRYFAERGAENRTENAALAPKIRRLLGLLGGRMPQLENSLQFELRNIERHPEDKAGLIAMLYFYELAAVLAPDLADEMDVARDYLGASQEERSQAEEAVRPRLLEAFQGTPLVDRMRDSWFTAGSGIGFPITEAIGPLLAALERSAP